MKVTLIKYIFPLLLTIAQTASGHNSMVPLESRRSVEQTLLTFPEWFLVHSPSEYARLLYIQPAHDFPYMGHVSQVWSSYWTVTQEQFRARYPLNPGYHVMIFVLASSTSVEYGLRSAYENTIGRISWAFTGGEATAEDVFAAKTAQEYVDFIQQEPWYLFDFSAHLGKLWTDVPLVGPDLLRKWERRYVLTSEYIVKALYAKLIKNVTRATYEVALMDTSVVIDPPPDDLKLPPRVTVLQTFADGKQLLILPRYYDFRLAASALAKQGVRITDIAGNNGEILVTVWTKSIEWIPAPTERVLFTQRIQTPANTLRAGMMINVQELSAFLESAPSRGFEVEHVYDY